MGKAAIAALSLILVVGVVIGTATATATAVANVTTTAYTTITGVVGVGSGLLTGMKMVDTLCSLSDIHKDLCIETLSPVAKGDANATPKAFLEAYFQAILEAVNKALNDSNSLDKDAKDRYDVSSLDVCKKYIGYMAEDLGNAIPKVSEIETTTRVDSVARELNIILSAVLSYKSTCVEEMDNPQLKEALQGGVLLNTTQLAKNGLAIVNEVQSLVKVDKKPNRRLLEVGNQW